MSASPESFRRTRPNAACPFWDRELVLLSDLEADGAAHHDVLAGRGRERGSELLDRLRLVLLLVHVLLIEEHHVVQPLLHAALGDPMLDVLGLAFAGSLFAEDPHLTLAVLLGDV